MSLWDSLNACQKLNIHILFRNYVINSIFTAKIHNDETVKIHNDETDLQGKLVIQYNFSSR